MKCLRGFWIKHREGPQVKSQFIAMSFSSVVFAKTTNKLVRFQVVGTKKKKKEIYCCIYAYCSSCYYSVSCEVWKCCLFCLWYQYWSQQAGICFKKVMSQLALFFSMAKSAQRPRTQQKWNHNLCLVIPGLGWDNTERLLLQLHGTCSVDKLTISIFWAVNSKTFMDTIQWKEEKKREREKEKFTVLLVAVKPFLVYISIIIQLLFSLLQSSSLIIATIILHSFYYFYSFYFKVYMSSI